MTQNKGHFCYGCNEFFHNTDPRTTEHKGCKGKKSLGACIDSLEFGEYHYYNLRDKTTQELIDIIHKLDNTKLAFQNKTI